MSWKKELLKGLVELKGEVGRIQGVIMTQDSMIQRQQGMIEKLMDRIQSKSLEEYKGVNPTVEAVAQEGFYDPLMDEDLAGTAMQVEEGPNAREIEK